MLEPNELRVCMDIGRSLHRVGIGLSTGELLEEFDVSHTSSGIESFFAKVESYKEKYQLPVAIAMEAYNGYARPIDQYLLERGYRLLNVNNHKLAQFKKIFPGAAKSDKIDTQKMFELFSLNEHLLMAKNVLQEVYQSPEVNNKLKRITRRRTVIVEERVRVLNRMQGDIKSSSPGLMELTKNADNIWFLSFLTARDDIRKLPGIREKGLLEIRGVGKRYLEAINEWQKSATFSVDTEWVGEMIIQDAARILELTQEIKVLEKTIESLSLNSEIAQRIRTIPGFGLNSAGILAGEIGTLSRFKSESSLALYAGMAVLENSSGSYRGTKKSIHVNKNCKKGLMYAVARHINCCHESKLYYDKKRAEGKKHNQAVRSLGRHLIRVIWSMLKNKRDYMLREEMLLKTQ